VEKVLDLSLFRYFEGLEDPRDGPALRHLLMDVVVIALCAVICGANTWVDVENFGLAQYGWLKLFLELPNGIPSHDTFGRIFAALDPVQFERCFHAWMNVAAQTFRGQVIAIDGKTARRSHERILGKRALHMVSAWATANHVVLGQVKTEDHSNEIAAIPELLNMLDIEDCIVTIDAMGCQKKIAEQVLEQGGDYILALKENQPELYKSVCTLFAPALLRGNLSYTKHDHTHTLDKGHGRLEKRRCWVIPASEWRFYLDIQEKWPGLQSVIMVKAERTLDGKTTAEPRYYISSLPCDARRLLDAVRSHWGIENGLHWVLDIAFREDESRVRKGHGQHNLTILRRLALNLLRKADGVKGGIQARRLRAAWDREYLLHVLQS
jgi:predicted transposase YbfD/YdcC